MSTKICINNLIGLPASGKTTFCKQFITFNPKTVGVIHICFDDFIKIQSNDEYFQSKSFQRDRFQLRCLINAIVEQLKQHGSAIKFNEICENHFPEAIVPANKSFKNCNEFLLLIDDNMYYKSMRKQIRNISVEHKIGYFQTYFSVAIDKSIERNRQRNECLPNDFLWKMREKFELPIDTDGEFTIQIDSDDNIVLTIEEILFTVMPKQMEDAIEISNKNDAKQLNETHQSIVHQIDLILRKEINRRMLLIDDDVAMKKIMAKLLCQRRRQLLAEIRSNEINKDLVNSLDDWKEFI